MLESDEGRYKQIGIISFGSKEGCNRGYPQVYTRVGFYRDWIRKTMTENAPDRLEKWFTRVNDLFKRTFLVAVFFILILFLLCHVKERRLDNLRRRQI